MAFENNREFTAVSRERAIIEVSPDSMLYRDLNSPSAVC